MLLNAGFKARCKNRLFFEWRGAFSIDLTFNGWHLNFDKKHFTPAL